MNQDKIFTPDSLDSFLGQDNSIIILKAAISKAKTLNKCIDHVLIYGNPGLGKTTIAGLIAKETNAHFTYISAPSISNNIELIQIISTIKENDVIFIDEIHRLSSKVEEILYTVMENFKLAFIFNNAENVKAMEMEIPRFTLVAATTKIHKLSLPLKSRFPIQLKLNDYNDESIFKIGKRMLESLSLKIDDQNLKYLASTSRNNPRILKNIIGRILDFSSYYQHEIDFSLLNKTFKHLGLYQDGLDEIDVNIMKIMYFKYKNRPISLSTIAMNLNEQKDDIESVHEPYLVEKEYILRTKSGRILTEKAIEYLLKIDKNHKFE